MALDSSYLRLGDKIGKKTHAHLFFKCQLYSLVLPQCIISRILSWPFYRHLHRIVIHNQQTASSLSQFSSDLVRGVHARARRETRETRAWLSRLAPSVTRVVICLSRAFCSTDQAKKTLLIVYIISASFKSRSLKANLPRIPLQPQMPLFLNVVVSRQWIITVDNKTILL